MRKLFVTILTIVWGISAVLAAQKSRTIVYINGVKYYVHTVQAGETLYSLSKLYEVDKSLILKNNPTIAEGLRTDENIKIPLLTTKKEERSKRKLRKTFETHVVAKGETLFAIARKFEIPIQTITEDNPELDPTHLSIGDRILIRKKQIGTEDEQGTMAAWQEYRDNLNSVSGDSVRFHIVQKGETFYSISKQFHITEQELSEWNNGLQPQDLKAGAMLRVEIDLPKPEEQIAESQVETPSMEVPQVDFRAVPSTQVLKVALLLPLSTKSVPNHNYIDFYEGFLMGLDSVKNQHGYSIDLTLFNTKKDEAQIKEFLSSDDFKGTNLIVGPVYENLLYPVLRYAEENEIPVVSPLAHIEKMNSDVLFQMAPNQEKKYDKMKDCISPDKSVTLIYSEGTDKEFEEEILEMLGNHPYKRHQYKYVHPTLHDNPDEFSTADLTPIMQNKDDNVYIIMSDNEIEVDRILAAMASANTNLVARSLANPRYQVLGNARWNRYNNIDRTMFFKNHVIFMSTYHAKRDVEIIRTFDKAYLRAFGSLPSLFSYRGYDAAMIFVPGMYNDINYDMEGRRYMPLQTVYRFEQETPNDNHVNNNWMKVSYHPDFTITLD